MPSSWVPPQGRARGEERIQAGIGDADENRFLERVPDDEHLGGAMATLDRALGL
jgi:hypothetical protein